MCKRVFFRNMDKGCGRVWLCLINWTDKAAVSSSGSALYMAIKVCLEEGFTLMGRHFTFFCKKMFIFQHNSCTGRLQGEPTETCDQNLHKERGNRNSYPSYAVISKHIMRARRKDVLQHPRRKATRIDRSWTLSKGWCFVPSPLWTFCTLLLAV